MVFLKDFFLEKLIFKKNSQMIKKHAKLPSIQRVSLLTFTILWATSADDTVMISFSYLCQKIGFDISYMTPLGWLGRKTSTQTNKHFIQIVF